MMGLGIHGPTDLRIQMVDSTTANLRTCSRSFSRPATLSTVELWRKYEFDGHVYG